MMSSIRCATQRRRRSIICTSAWKQKLLIGIWPPWWDYCSSFVRHLHTYWPTMWPGIQRCCLSCKKGWSPWIRRHWLIYLCLSVCLPTWWWSTWTIMWTGFWVMCVRLSANRWRILRVRVTPGPATEGGGCYSSTSTSIRIGLLRPGWKMWRLLMHMKPAAATSQAIPKM